MYFIKNLNLGVRLGLGFASVLAMLAGIAGVGIYALSHEKEALDSLVNDNVHQMSLSQDMSEAVHITSLVIRTIVLLDEPAAREVERAKGTKARADYDTAWEALNKTEASDRGKAIRAKIDAAKTDARAENNKVMELALANKDAEALVALMKQAGPAVTAWQGALDDNVELQKENTKKAVVAAEAEFQKTRALLLSMTGLAMVLGSLIAWFIARSITVPINQAVKVAQTVAAGDLTSKIDVTSSDETGRLLQALKEMNESLVSVVSNVRQSSDSIATGSAQIATGNADLSQRTEEQASNLQQTAASMEQLTSTVKQNSDTAGQANQLAMGASEAAVKGGVVVGQVVGTMHDITASSKKISDIIGVIDGIAFQTNILALNAAVEAARAGEQGRGFAVVASEVRSLAQRSANAAKEIKTLIGESVQKVEAGSKLVDAAGKSMEDIVIQVKRVTDLIAEISSASIEQTQGIGQVGDAVNQLDQVTQQNAALVEESAAAADSLSQQAARLAEVVGVFKLGAGQNPTPSQAASTHASHSVAERRGPNRATNVMRPKFVAKGAGAGASAKAPARAAGASTPVAAKTGTDDWESF